MFCYCFTKYSLHVTSAQSTTQETLRTTSCLLRYVDSIYDLLRITWRKIKWAMHDMPSSNLSSIFLLKSHTQNYHCTSLRRRMGNWEVCSKTLLKLHKNWVSCIGKCGPYYFAQLTTILFNPYWKHSHLKNQY